MELKLKVQNIYYQTPEDKLEITRVPPTTKYYFKQAREHLTAQNIPFKEILKTKTEYVTIELDNEELNELIK